jgi:hypothetical protein
MVPQLETRPQPLPKGVVCGYRVETHQGMNFDLTPVLPHLYHPLSHRVETQSHPASGTGTAG